MPKKNCLGIIYEFVTEKKLEPMKRWSTRSRINMRTTKKYKILEVKEPGIKKILSKVREILNLISGNDIIELLKG
jgi:hypothetical protein